MVLLVIHWHLRWLSPAVCAAYQRVDPRKNKHMPTTGDIMTKVARVDHTALGCVVTAQRRCAQSKATNGAKAAPSKTVKSYKLFTCFQTLKTALNSLIVVDGAHQGGIRVHTIAVVAHDGQVQGVEDIIPSVALLGSRYRKGCNKMLWNCVFCLMGQIACLGHYSGS